VGASVLSVAAGGIGIVELRRGRTRPSNVEPVIEPARMFRLNGWVVRGLARAYLPRGSRATCSWPSDGGCYGYSGKLYLEVPCFCTVYCK